MPLFNWFKEKCLGLLLWIFRFWVIWGDSPNIRQGKSVITKSHENLWSLPSSVKTTTVKIVQRKQANAGTVCLGINEGGFELNTPARNCKEFKSILQYLYSIFKWLIKIRRLKTFLYNPTTKNENRLRFSLSVYRFKKKIPILYLILYLRTNYY